MNKRGRAGAAAIVTVAAVGAAMVAASPARAGGVPGLGGGFLPGNLVVSESVYGGNPGIVAGKTDVSPGTAAVPGRRLRGIVTGAWHDGRHGTR